MLEKFPSRQDGPPKRSWAPAIPACGGGNGGKKRAFKFSVQTEDGVTHRFLLTRAGMAWLAASFVAALSPSLGRLAWWWAGRQGRMGAQSDKSSDSRSLDGSPQEGQAE